MAFPWMMAAQMGIGAVQSIISAAKASDLPEPEQYSVTPELRRVFNKAEARADQGYSPAERAAFDQMLARQANSAKNMFRNVGLSGAGSAAANIMSIDALNQFAAGSEAVRRQNFGQYAGLAGEIQQVDNMEVNRQNQRLMAEEQALGGGIQAGISNVFQGLNTGQNINWMNQAAEIYNGQSGGASGGGVNIPSMLNSGGGGRGGAMTTPSPLWNSFESQGFPFLPSGQQQGSYQAPNSVDPALLGTPSFGSPGFGAATDWNQVWGGGSNYYGFEQ